MRLARAGLRGNVSYTPGGCFRLRLGEKAMSPHVTAPAALATRDAYPLSTPTPTTTTTTRPRMIFIKMLNPPPSLPPTLKGSIRLPGDRITSLPRPNLDLAGAYATYTSDYP